MKNKIKILLILTILFIPYIVKADMGGPMLKPYEMVVTAPDGIDYYNYDYNTEEFILKGHLNKEDTFIVNFENKISYSIIIGKEQYDLKNLNGAIPVKNEIKPEDEINKTSENDHTAIKKLDKIKEALVNAENGVDLRKGPADAYEKIIHINKGEKVKYNYYLSGDGITHIYAEYKGQKGWLDILNKKVLISEEKETKYIARNEIITNCTTISKNTILSPTYITDQWSGSALFDFNNCTSLIRTFHSQDLIEISNEREVVAKESIDVYEYGDITGNILETIPKNEHFYILGLANNYEEMTIYYISYKNKKGWIKANYQKIDFSDAQLPSEPTTEPTVEPTTTEQITETSNIKNPVDYVTTYVIIGISVALAVLMIIILINKKKKNKEEVKNIEN